jgi:hypothetical protein
VGSNGTAIQATAIATSTGTCTASVTFTRTAAFLIIKAWDWRCGRACTLENRANREILDSPVDPEHHSTPWSLVADMS